MELTAIARVHSALIHFARRAVVTSPYFPVTEARFERGRNLQIRTHFENTVIGTAGRCDSERLFETSEMRFHVALGGRVGRPGKNIFRVDVDGLRAFGWLRPGSRASMGWLSIRGRAVPVAITGNALQKIRVALRYFGPGTFGLHPLARPRAQRPAQLRPAYQHIEVLEKMILFARVHWRFQADGVRQLAEGTNLRDHHRFTEPQSAHQRA